MRALLDVNVLIALLDAEHVHHEPARRWLRNNIRNGWATCPITQNGCLRIMSQPSYPGGLRSAQVAERLREATATRHHEFWPRLGQPVGPGSHLLATHHRCQADHGLLSVGIGGQTARVLRHL